jgi:beta-carotene 15,15'-dioxygenase
MTKPESIRWLMGSLLLLAIYFIHPDAAMIIALALIMLIGLPHGAADAWRLKQQWPRLHHYMVAMTLYAAVAFAFANVFLHFPMASLIVFIIISAWHFGTYDAHKATRWAQLAIGSLFIFGPFLFWKASIEGYFLAIGLTTIQSSFLLNIGVYIFIASALLTLLAAVLLFKQDRKPLLGCLLTLPVAMALPPLLSFSLYFCLLHAPRQSASLNKQLAQWWQNPIVVAALAMTWVAAGAWFYFSNLLAISERLALVLIIGMASLTVPHMVLDLVLSQTHRWRDELTPR